MAGGQFLLRAEAVEFQRGDLLAARYQIEKAIGRGATGSVLQAFDRVVRAVVAVKILRVDLATDERWVERLGGELRYARKLQHPNICRVFDIGEADGHHFLTMEFASRGSLRQRLAEPGAKDRPWEERIADARSVIDGLAAIHAADIVHRDVKPENVLVMEDGRLVVSDFGVAVSLGTTTYFSSQVAGTPSYMAPEVIMGEKATPASDVFSLGIVLHEILFTRRPDWQMTKQGRVLKSPADGKASKRERAFARLCVECLAEFAPKRPRDAAEVRKRFDQAVGGRLQPLRARLRQRWPIIVGTLAVAGAAATVALGRHHRHSEVQPSASAAIAHLTGKAIDLDKASTTLLTSSRIMRCFDLLPGGRSVRLIWTRPAGAVDIDLATGKSTPSPIVPAVLEIGCPRLSPDGQKVLYDERGKAGSRIMLSMRPDGADAEVVTEGSSPVWLPSSAEFVYAFDRRVGAVFSLGPKTRVLLPESPPFEKMSQDIAVNAAGDQVAFLFRDAHGDNTIETYNYPSMTSIGTRRVKEIVQHVAFDPLRRSLETMVADSQHLILAELTGASELVRLAAAQTSNVYAVARSPLGLVIFTTTVSRSMIARSASGEERTFAYSGAYSTPSLSDKGDALVETIAADGRFVISLQRWSEGRSTAVTSGPLDAYPSFAADGATFVYARIPDNALMACRLQDGNEAKCRTIVTDALGPRGGVLSPDGTLVAYRTVYGANTRLRVVPFAGGSVRDLGVLAGGCPLLWSAPSAVSVYYRLKGEWEEVDVTTKQRTGRRSSRIPPSAACDDSPDYARARPAAFRLRKVETQSIDLRLSTKL